MAQHTIQVSSKQFKSILNGGNSVTIYPVSENIHINDELELLEYSIQDSEYTGAVIYGRVCETALMVAKDTDVFCELISIDKTLICL